MLEKFASQTKSFKNSCMMKIKLKTNFNMTISKKIKKFQQQIRLLIYLMTCTKFDLYYSIDALTRFMSNSGFMHFKILNQIWKYFTYTWDYDLFYALKNLIDFIYYCDADWKNGFDIWKSITNYIHLFWHTAITWKSSLQKTVVLSSIKIEYMELKESVKESMFLNMFFQSVLFLKQYNVKQI